MSNLIPSTFRSTQSQAPVRSGDSPGALASTECEFCRLSGTATFAFVSLYAFNQARKPPYRPLGRIVAVLGGTGFLAAAVGRWNVVQSTPPKQDEPVTSRL
ncbi:BZ3500_MvSof-1268-A1-R1_Chr3-1g05825 [Microbotryum saponariae]|uniref:BZ3500_MvSof-1268-A1-R1_Chr3-1g05825 protein n=1 Tax=Microbotryum saponariae TaxID=289078 RepID=A0A2X0LS77_9BASI|nr:BZ3500_MvSof-1268-A1-R1_Chr3-1g05825 [Microbotryum saponariae]SDA05015.1 BZ3501_MvSof-1269-A2-R1_Chr3-1g05495 [Microbotryum saponariae]